MKCKPLKDVAQIIMGQSPDSSSYNEVGEGLPFFQGNADFGVMYPSERIWCNQPKKIANENDILISVRAPIGALNYANKKCCIGRGLAAITVNNPVERNYIFHLLKAKNAELNRKGTGSTFKAIGKNVLEDIPVPIVSSEIQLHITRLMDITESIISKRKNELKYYDELIKARFVEMFDFSNCSYGTFGNDTDFVDYRGKTPKLSETGNIRMVNAKSVGKGVFKEVNEYITEEIYNEWMHRGFGYPGDVLFVTEGHTFGNTCLVPDHLKKFALGQRVITIKGHENVVDNVFLCAYMQLDQFMQDIIVYRTGGTAQGIRSKDLVKVKIPLPDYKKQKMFSNFAKQVDKSKVEVQKSLEQTQLLFDSLMQQYFG